MMGETLIIFYFLHKLKSKLFKEQKLCTKYLKNQIQLEGAHQTWIKLSQEGNQTIICIQDSQGQIYQRISRMKNFFPLIQSDAKNLVYFQNREYRFQKRKYNKYGQVVKDAIKQRLEMQIIQIIDESRIVALFNNKNKLIIKRGSKQLRSFKLAEKQQLLGMGLAKDKLVVLSYCNNTLDFLSLSISDNHYKKARVLGVLNNFLHNKQRVAFQSSNDGKYFFFNNALYSIEEGFKSVFTSRCYDLQFNKDSTQIGNLQTFKEILVLNYAPLMENIWDKHYYFDFDNKKLYVNNWAQKSELIFYKQ
ncbi:hypothetical protein pb186bvf_003840 [Paramecium bursaria]